MSYVNGYGQLCDGHFPSEDNNGQPHDPEPWPQTPHKPPRLRRVNRRHDIQYCPVGYWATHEGALLRIRAMSDRHIANSMALMERHAHHRAWNEALRASLYADDAPDGAADAANEAATELLEMASDPDYDTKVLARIVWPKYHELEEEQTRRTEGLRG